MRISLVFFAALIAGVPALADAPVAGEFSNSWQLDFRFYDLQRLSVRLPGDNANTVYWYMTYQVVNNSGKDVQFYPSFRLVTDTLRPVESGEGVSPHVYDVIAARHKVDFPFFSPPSKVSGLLLQGEENARASAAVFREFDSQASGFTIYVSGLSGELQRIPNPAFEAQKPESSANPRAFLLRRTLAIRYDLPGDSKTIAMSTPVRRSRQWVMQ